MQKVDTVIHIAKLVALCLPPVAMSLIGLAALSGNKRSGAVVAGKRPVPGKGVAGGKSA